MDKELLSIDNIAKKFKQSGETCLLASILFSLALQFRDVDPKNEVLKDINNIINGRKSFSQLEYEIEDISVYDSDLREWSDEISPRAYVTDVIVKKKQEKLRNYLAFSGYTIELCRSSRDQLVETIKKHPLIYLLYPDSKFFNMRTPFIIQHVISAVRIEDDNLVIFEPYAGEIRKREIPHVENFGVTGELV